MSSSFQENKQLDLESYERVAGRLREALDEHRSNPANLYVLDSVVKRFELTYELASRSLRRFLIDYALSASEIADMSFAGIVRRGVKEGLLGADLATWQHFRDARNATVHAYFEEKARETAAEAELFLPEAERLLDNLKRRTAKS